MKLGLKKAVVLGLSASLVLSVFSGCSKKGEFKSDAVAVTVNKDKVSAGLVKFATRYSQAQIEDLYKYYFGMENPFNQDMYGNGVTLGEDMKQDMLETLVNQVLKEQHMEEYGVSVSEDEKKAIADAAAAFLADNDEEVLTQMAADQATVERYLELKVVEKKMNAAMSADVDTEVSDEEAAQRKVKTVIFNPVTEEKEPVEAESETEKLDDITPAELAAAETAAPETEAETAAPETAAPETEEETAALESETAAKTKEAAQTEEDVPAETEAQTEDPEAAAAKEAARAKAANMISLVQGGQDFDAAAEQLGMTATETTFDSEYYVPELVTATDGLADGTLVAEPVEVGNSFYVVYLETQLDREATDAKKESIVGERRNEMINNLVNEWSEAAEMKADSKVMEKIDFYVSLSNTHEDAEEVAESELETEQSDRFV